MRPVRFIVYSFSNHGTFDYFAEQAWELFFEKDEDYTEYLMLEDQGHVSGYWKSPVTLEEVEGYLTPSMHQNIDKIPEGVDDNDDWDFNGAIGGKSAQRVSIKRKLQDL